MDFVFAITARYVFAAAVCYLGLWAVMAIVYGSISLRNDGLRSWGIHETTPYTVPTKESKMRLAAIGALAWPVMFVPITLRLLYVMVANHIAFHRIHKRHYP